MLTAVAFLTSHDRSEALPGVMVPGDAEKETMLGMGITVTVAVAVVNPVTFVAVRRKVVVTIGPTACEIPVTAPIPWSRVSASAPETFQVSVDLPPGPTVAGSAAKEAITGLIAATQEPAEQIWPTAQMAPSGFDPVATQVGGDQ